MTINSKIFKEMMLKQSMDFNKAVASKSLKMSYPSKNISNKQFNGNIGLKKKYGLNNDFDMDGVRNKDDCYPFDASRDGLLGNIAMKVQKDFRMRSSQKAEIKSAVKKERFQAKKIQAVRFEKERAKVITDKRLQAIKKSRPIQFVGQTRPQIKAELKKNKQKIEVVVKQTKPKPIGISGKVKSIKGDLAYLRSL